MNGHTYNYSPDTINLLEEFRHSTKIIEIVNTIDTSDYLEVTDENNEKEKTDLQTEYKMPTIEIIYVLQ